jgi:uncharacterized protein (TIGR02246 family)
MISKLVAIILLVAARMPAATVEDQVRAVLERQQKSWNDGDTEGFLEGYASDAVFMGDKVTRGVEDLRRRYQARYPTRGAMGQLTFYGLEIHPMGNDYAWVIGRWELKRDKEGGGDTGGVYSLVFRKTAIGWKIVLDHTN